ncbi:hypothetical protein Syun_017633 [Stephania yunnanensis]|uniref:Uncharacterized protein n=1 Tax=Stephania yunnanensis TaxID=152371 RepID=A0AAP0J9K1_9MAGN
MAGDHDKITAMINLLTNEFTSSPLANHQNLKLFQAQAAFELSMTHSRADWRKTPAIRNQLHIWILVKGTDLISAVVSASKSSFLVDLPETKKSKTETVRGTSIKEKIRIGPCMHVMLGEPNPHL